MIEPDFPSDTRCNVNPVSSTELVLIYF